MRPVEIKHTTARVRSEPCGIMTGMDSVTFVTADRATVASPVSWQAAASRSSKDPDAGKMARSRTRWSRKNEDAVELPRHA
jgi:hypothetical protein